MSDLLKKLFDFIKLAIQNATNINDFRKLIKWIAFVSTIIWWYKYIRPRKHPTIVMIPGWNKWIGHFGMARKHLHHINEHLYECAKELDFPPYAAFNAFNKFAIMIHDPDIAKFVFHTKFESFKKGERIQRETEELLGDGIFASDPPRWKMHRKIASRMFSMRNLKNYMYECTVDHTKKVINKINSDENNLNDIDIYNMLARFTLDAFTSIAFGKSVNSVSLYPQKHPFSEAFDNLITAIAIRHITLDMIWKPIRMLPYSLTFGNEFKIKRDIRIIDEFAHKVLSSRQTEISSICDEQGEKYNDIISLFMKYDPTLTQTELKHIAMNMIIAGRDTTRLLLSWFLYEMCLNQNTEIKLKIYNEIDEYIETNGNKINYETASNGFLYLECCLLEALRLHPVVPFLMRYAVEDVTLPSGDVIKKGNEVLIPTFIIGRNPKIYSNPLKFDPNRFYNKGKAPVKVKSVYEYPFFNINPRLCLGRHLALMESKVFIFYFFKTYSFEMVDKNQQIKIQPGVVLNMVEGLRLKLTKNNL